MKLERKLMYQNLNQVKDTLDLVKSLVADCQFRPPSVGDKWHGLWLRQGYLDYQGTTYSLTPSSLEQMRQVYDVASRWLDEHQADILSLVASQRRKVKETIRKRNKQIESLRQALKSQ